MSPSQPGSINKVLPTWQPYMKCSIDLPSLSSIDWPPLNPPTHPPIPPSLATTTDWEGWLAQYYPGYVAHPFAPRHRALWAWVWTIELGVRPAPFIGIWPRGGAKSTSAELGCVALASRRARRYGWYLSETQDQADDHVANVASALEHAGFDRAVNKYGTSKGWRRNRVRTPDYTLDALGLDTARRGAKLDAQRPDHLIIDDVDGELDTAETTDKKIRVITRKLLPAGTPDLAVLGIQNTVHPDSIFARFVDGRADFLSDRIVSGPEVALLNFDADTDYDSATGRILRGTPSWAGQGIQSCEDYIRTWGLESFRAECQHEAVAGALAFLPDMALWDACTETFPPLGNRQPAVLVLDGAISGDTFGRMLLTRHPARRDEVAMRDAWGYVPPKDGKLDFIAINADLRRLVRTHNIVQVCYDPYQLHQMAQQLSAGHPGGLLPDGTIEPPTPAVWCEPFGQTTERIIADKQLLDLIVGKRFWHDGNAQLRQHISNANRKPAEEHKLRLVKGRGKIDLAVCASMGAARILELNLW